MHINNNYKIIDNNIDNKNNLNIDNNIDKSKYSLKDSFVPSTEDSVVAREIASYLNDLKNYAFYYKCVQTIGPSRAQKLLSETKEDIRLREKTADPIKVPGALYNWKVSNYLNSKKEEL